MSLKFTTLFSTIFVLCIFYALQHFYFFLTFWTMLENNTRIQQFIHQRVNIILISNSKAKYPFIWIDWIVGWDQKNYIKIIKYSKKEKISIKIVTKWVFWFHWMISKQRFFQYNNKSKKKTSRNIRSLWWNILRTKLYRII